MTCHITFVAAVNDKAVLRNNLLASPCLQSGLGHELIIQENFPSAASAYNDAIRKARNDLLVFIHQDVFLPNAWIPQLDKSLLHLDTTDPAWGVLGCWGATRDGSFHGHVYSTGLGILGGAFERPIAVQTLDEIVLIVRRGKGLTFDETLPHFHFYGTDICLRSAARQFNCYSISAFCVHNTHQLIKLPREFYQCYAHVKRKWRSQMPIQTTCIRMSRLDVELTRRRVEDLWNAIRPCARRPAERVAAPAEIVIDC